MPKVVSKRMNPCQCLPNLSAEVRTPGVHPVPDAYSAVATSRSVFEAVPRRMLAGQGAHRPALEIMKR